MKYIAAATAILSFVLACVGVNGSSENNFRGLQVACKTNADCYQPCTKLGCPIEKVCYKNVCRPAKYFLKCGPSLCNLRKNESCCNESCGICVKPGGGCTKQFCSGETCGKTTCKLGETCCKDCNGGGFCVPKEIGECPLIKCPAPVECGGSICGAGEYCCNESCGICAKDGDACITLFCGNV